MAKTEARILVVDDDEDVLIAAKLLLKRHFTHVDTLNHPSQIAELTQENQYDVFLLDMNFEIGVNTGKEGLDWLERLIAADSTSVVVLMTAYGGVETSVNALKKGAADFVLKPWQNEKLLATLHSALLLSQSRKQVKHLDIQKKEISKELNRGTQSNIVAESKPMRNLLKMVHKAARTDANVLILGENGSGKEVIAREVFQSSRRASEVMLSVDLGAVPENLFESELFGHVKGAFTDAQSDRAGRFQAASGGTLFLDEIGNLPLHLQAKLLRVLENREVCPVGSDKTVKVDVRLICATNMPLEEMVEDGRFRADLYYRINTVQLEIPALRQRPTDIPVLLDYFIDSSAKKYHLDKKDISSSAVKQLCEYAWPGNVRELAHTVERALILSDGEVLEADDFFLRKASATGKTLTSSTGVPSLNLEELEKFAIAQSLEKHDGNISHAADELGITRTSLYRRLKKHHL